MRIFICWTLLLSLWACGTDDGPVSPPPDDAAGPLSPAQPIALTAPFYFGNRHQAMLPADNPTTDRGVELGRMLFYEKALSADQTISCGSCHQQSKAFTDGRALAVGIGGAVGTRSSMSLANLMWVSRLFWDGRVDGRQRGLETQALIPIEDPIEMHLPLPQAVARLQADARYVRHFEAAFGTPEVTDDRIARALAQFQRTLVSHNARFDKFLRREVEFTEEELRGYQLFTTHPIASLGLRGGNCGDCHLGPLLAGDLTDLRGFHNNGIQTDFPTPASRGLENLTGRPEDRGKFRAPSLRNIAVTAPYMHDGRFRTLEEVLDHYNSPELFGRPNVDMLVLEGHNDFFGESLALTEDEKRAIITFLRTLTDEQFLTDPAFGDPHP